MTVKYPAGITLFVHHRLLKFLGQELTEIKTEERLTVVLKENTKKIKTTVAVQKRALKRNPLYR